MNDAKPGSIGVLLSDSIFRLFIVDTVWRADGELELYPLHRQKGKPLIVPMSEFWPLIDQLP